MKTRRAILWLAAALIPLSAQPSMPISPVQGNPADLRIQMQPWGYTSFEIKIGLDCSFFLSGSLVLMDNGQYGGIGSYGSVGNLCQIEPVPPRCSPTDTSSGFRSSALCWARTMSWRTTRNTAANTRR